MNVKNAKKEQVTCTNCGHVMALNAWGIPKVSQYEGAIERALIKLKTEMGFGIKEKYERNKEERNGKKNS